MRSVESNGETSFALDSVQLVGVNHRVAPVEVREKLAFRPERLIAALEELRLREMDREGGGETTSSFVLLSTCNRTEVYTCSPDPEQTKARVLAYLAEHAHLSPKTLEQFCYVDCGEPAILHLLQVAAGLDSLIIGENEILGQVGEAYEAALKAGSAGSHLSAMFRTALQAGKRVRNETEIGRMGLSVASVVVRLAQETFGGLENRTALLIGAGKISALTARLLCSSGLRCILVANRTFERAQKLAASLSGHGATQNSAVHFEKMPECLIEADIVISSTGAPHIVLHPEMIQKAMAARPDRPLLVIDLAVPRDADPSITEIEGVRLVDIDDLRVDLADCISTDRMSTGQEIVEPYIQLVCQQAENIIQDELQCFKVWVDERRNAALICALQNRASAIVGAQVKKTIRKMGELSPEQQDAVAAMGKAIASQLLHEPIICLKRAHEQEIESEIETLVPRLFGLY